MVNPIEITKFDRNQRELEEFWLFSMFVAGKNSDFAARKLQSLTSYLGDHPLIGQMRGWKPEQVEKLLRLVKVGQYDRLTKAIVGSFKLDLRTATLQDLMDVHGVGPKTARFFLLHSRENCECAVLDTHILKFLRANGYLDAPKSTPSGSRYVLWEGVFLSVCKHMWPEIPIAVVDLNIWRRYSGRVSA